jgi:hypothetical protein
MKEHPILFSTKMVQAILARKKSMTRRIIKFPKDFTGEKVYDNYPFGLKYTSFLGGGTVQRLFPKWEVGDVLWVRETVCFVLGDHVYDLLEGANSQWVYKASVHPDWMKYAKEKYHYKWKPSIFMPRSACRILLEITDIKAELLNDISENDAKKEGAIPSELASEITAFCNIWESIHGEGSWNINPWVWCPEFKIKEVK